MIFHGTSILLIVLVLAPLTTALMNGEDPFSFTLFYVLRNPTRVTLCIGWLSVLSSIWVFRHWLQGVSSRANDSSPAAVATPQVEDDDDTATARKELKKMINIRRKFYHAIVFLIVVPGWFFDIKFLSLALTTLLSIFLLCEFHRALGVSPFGLILDSFMKTFTDEKDASGPLITGHIYLLCGVAGGIWLQTCVFLDNQIFSRLSNSVHSHSMVDSPPGIPPLAALAGAIILGLGDSIASIIGYSLGDKRHKWPGTSKSLEGTIGFMISVGLGGAILESVLRPGIHIKTMIPWFVTSISCGMSPISAHSCNESNLHA